MKKLIFYFLLFFVTFATIYAQCPYTNKDMCQECEGDYFYIVENATDNNNVVIIETAPNYYILTAREPVVFMIEVYFEDGHALEYAYMTAISINEQQKYLIIRYFDVDDKGVKVLISFKLDKVCGVKVKVV